MSSTRSVVRHMVSKSISRIRKKIYVNIGTLSPSFIFVIYVSLLWLCRKCCDTSIFCQWTLLSEFLSKLYFDIESILNFPCVINWPYSFHNPVKVSFFCYLYVVYPLYLPFSCKFIMFFEEIYTFRVSPLFLSTYIFHHSLLKVFF